MPHDRMDVAPVTATIALAHGHRTITGMRGWKLVVLALFFYAGAKLSLAFAVMPDVLVMLWIPNAIVLASLLRDRKHDFVWIPAVLLGELAADFLTFSWPEALAFGTINVVEIGVAYVLLQRLRFDPSFAAPADIGKFLAAGPLFAAFASACAAAAVYVLRGATTPYAELVRVWWFSDGLGLLMVTPLVLGFWPASHSRERIALRWYDAVAFAAALAIVLAFALSRQREFHGLTLRAFLLIPPVLYAAARFSLRGTAAAAAVISGVVLFLVKNGQQPFGVLPLRETVVSAQELILVLSTMSLSLGALLSQHRRIARELEARVEERTAALRVANERLQTLAATDALTGALNRRALFDLLQREVGRERRYHRPFAVIVFDVDHFKDVNDRWGHAAGDEVLQQVVAVALGVLRGSDVLARYGGEEFVIVAPETDRAGGVHLAERVRTALRSAGIAAGSDTIHITASFGVAFCDSADETPEQIVGRADTALYAAKAAGRDCVRIS